MSSDPTRTVDAEVDPVSAGGAADLSLMWLTAERGNVPLALDWRGASELIIGRDDECAIRLAGNDVSRRHAALRRTDDGATLGVVDLESRNGTRVNGKSVQSARLRPNDVLRIGGCVLVLVDSGAEFTDIAPGLAGGGALQRILLPLARAARSDLPIVLEGETGTGKELVANAHGKFKSVLLKYFARHSPRMGRAVPAARRRTRMSRSLPRAGGSHAPELARDWTHCARSARCSSALSAAARHRTEN